MHDTDALDVVRHEAVEWDALDESIAPLIEWIGDTALVLIGEASHGTDEFYRLRAALTAQLIQHRGFTIVAVEADWPDAYRVNQWVRHASDDGDARTALSDFVRFPRWMWRNEAVVDFIEWLRVFNAEREPAARAGFYGLDLYSLHASMQAVLRYLNEVDPDAARRARDRYGCLREFGGDPQGYGYAATLGLSRSCENEVVAQLVELRRSAGDRLTRGSRGEQEEYFSAEQNARLVQNAEQYYRAMFGGRVESWNLRDSHMMETLASLIEWRRSRREPARAVVWAHNSHLGDARATEMGSYGELNLGQLARQQCENRVFSVGFTSHEGTVTAARDWDAPAERRQVRPSIPHSYERLFHDSGISRFALRLRNGGARQVLSTTRLERAIGVVYKPESERASHYFRAKLAEQFDAVVHIDRTNALSPLEPWSELEDDLPETWPTGM